MNQANPSQSPVLIQAIEQTWQRVIALELNFKTYELGVDLKKNQQRRLAELITSVRNRLARMKLTLEAETELDAILQKLGLPPFQAHAAEEANVLVRMIDERRQSCLQTGQFLGKFNRWLEEAGQNKARFRSYLRLGKIKKHFDNIRQGRFELEIDQKSLINNVKQTLHAHSVSAMQVDDSIAIDDALERFHSIIHALLQSTQRLEQAVQNEQRQVLYMKNWLDEARTQIYHRHQAEPPEIKDLRTLNGQWDQHGFSQYYDSRKRLTIARNYVEHFLKQLRYIGDEKLWAENDPSS